AAYRRRDSATFGGRAGNCNSTSLGTSPGHCCCTPCSLRRSLLRCFLLWRPRRRATTSTKLCAWPHTHLSRAAHFGPCSRPTTCATNAVTRRTQHANATLLAHAP